MKQKKEKIVKILSDGTIAKVGMIVVVNWPKYIKRKTITKIAQTVNKKSINVFAVKNDLSIESNRDWLLIDGYFVQTFDVRKATPEERKQYYKDLYARNNQ